MFQLQVSIRIFLSSTRPIVAVAKKHRIFSTSGIHKMYHKFTNKIYPFLLVVCGNLACQKISYFTLINSIDTFRLISSCDVMSGKLAASCSVVFVCKM